MGLSAALIDVIVGVIWGSISAYAGGRIDEWMMRICDILYSLPYLLLVILLTVIRGTGLGTILIAMTVTGWINMARVARAQVLQLKTHDYIAAARVIGASPLRIIVRHILPNAIGPIMAMLTLTIPSAIFTESFLSFLGLGIQAPAASLGVMVSDALSGMRYYPWRLLFPAALLTIIMLSFNCIGNALRDALDPKLRGRNPKTARSLLTRLESVMNSGLEVKNLSVSYNVQGVTVRAVNNVSFTIKPGERVGLVGESGCGKTALITALLGLDSAQTVGGTALFNQQMPARVRGKEIGMIFQDPMTSLNPTMKIGAQIMEALLYHRLATRDEAKKRAIELLQLVGISEPHIRLNQYPHVLSGGQRQRVMIAIALACKPKLILADEPTTALDPTVASQILDLLSHVTDTLQTTLLLITHDLRAVASTCERVLVMHEGMIVEDNSVDEIFYHPRHPFTQLLLKSIPQGVTCDRAPIRI